MRLIINADDLGLSQEVNAGIFDLMSRKLVTSATTMMNTPYSVDTLRSLNLFPDCSFGVHLNLTEFAPLTRDPALRPILNNCGDFNGNAIRHVSLTPALKNAVFLEWSAQVEKFGAAGQIPSHLDSHHHTHTTPGLFPVLKRLQRCFGINKVRVSRNLYHSSAGVAAHLLLRKKLWNLALKYWGETRVTDGFTSFREFHNLVEDGSIARRFNAKRQTRAIIELMVHPGNPAYEGETRLLSADWFGDRGFDLISYRQL